MKTCTKCKIEKELSEFNKCSCRTDGYQSHCRVCTKKFNALHYKTSEKFRAAIYRTNKQNRHSNAQFVSRYKRMLGCKICRENDPCCLDLHHTDPSQKDGHPSAFVSQSRTKLKAEIRKCVVLCANCHRKVHAGVLTI